MNSSAARTPTVPTPSNGCRSSPTKSCSRIIIGRQKDIAVPASPFSRPGYNRRCEQLGMDGGPRTRAPASWRASRVDNGSEFCSRVLDAWAYENGVRLDFIRPSRPVSHTNTSTGLKKRSHVNCGRVRLPRIFITKHVIRLSLASKCNAPLWASMISRARLNPKPAPSTRPLRAGSAR